MTEAPQAILDLVERFSSNVDDYRSPSYNETQARREFIDPSLGHCTCDSPTSRRPRPRSCYSGRLMLRTGRLIGWYTNCTG